MFDPKLGEMDSPIWKGAKWSRDLSLVDALSPIIEEVHDGAGNAKNFVDREAQVKVLLAANALRLAGMIFQAMPKSILLEVCLTLAARAEELGRE